MPLTAHTPTRPRRTARPCACAGAPCCCAPALHPCIQFQYQARERGWGTVPCRLPGQSLWEAWPGRHATRARARRRARSDPRDRSGCSEWQSRAPLCRARRACRLRVWLDGCGDRRMPNGGARPADGLARGEKDSPRCKRHAVGAWSCLCTMLVPRRRPHLAMHSRRVSYGNPPLAPAHTPSG